MKLHSPLRKIVCGVSLFKTMFMVGLFSLTIFLSPSFAIALPSGDNAPKPWITLPGKSNLKALIMDEAKKDAFINLGSLNVVNGIQFLRVQTSQSRFGDFSSRLMNDSIFNTTTGAKPNSLIGFFLEEFPPMWASESTRNSHDSHHSALRSWNGHSITINGLGSFQKNRI